MLEEYLQKNILLLGDLPGYTLDEWKFAYLFAIDACIITNKPSYTKYATSEENRYKRLSESIYSKARKNTV